MLYLVSTERSFDDDDDDFESTEDDENKDDKGDDFDDNNPDPNANNLLSRLNFRLSSMKLDHTVSTTHKSAAYPVFSLFIRPFTALYNTSQLSLHARHRILGGIMLTELGLR